MGFLGLPTSHEGRLLCPESGVSLGDRCLSLVLTYPVSPLPYEALADTKSVSVPQPLHGDKVHSPGPADHAMFSVACPEEPLPADAKHRRLGKGAWGR